VDDDAPSSIMGPPHSALLPLVAPVVVVDAQLADSDHDEDADEGQTSQFEPVLESDAGLVAVQPLGYSEAVIQAEGTLADALKRVGGTLQVLIAVNAYFKTTQGKMGYLTVRGHTGFDRSDPAWPARRASSTSNRLSGNSLGS